MLDEFGVDARHAVGVVYGVMVGVMVGVMGLLNALQQRHLGLSPSAWCAIKPVVKPALRHAQRIAQCAHWKFGLVCLHEFVDDMHVISLLPANHVRKSLPRYLAPSAPA